MTEHAWAWPALDAVTAAELLTDHLPSTREAGGGRLTPIGVGDFSFAFRLGADVVRVARHAEAAAALHREVCVLSRIADRLPVRVPQPTYHRPDTCPPFTVHVEVTGEVLTRDAWLAMARPARERSAADLAAFLKALHAIPTSIGTDCGLARLDGAGLARALRREISPTFRTAFDDATLRRLDAVLAELTSPSSARRHPAALLHCDIAPGHILYDPASGRLTGVIDFGDVALGPPARDFIFIYEDFGTELLAGVTRHYAGDDAEGFLAEVRQWYLLEAVAWTLRMHAAKRRKEVEHGVREITRELESPPS